MYILRVKVISMFEFTMLLVLKIPRFERGPSTRSGVVNMLTNFLSFNHSKSLVIVWISIDLV